MRPDKKSGVQAPGFLFLRREKSGAHDTTLCRAYAAEAGSVRDRETQALQKTEPSKSGTQGLVQGLSEDQSLSLFGE